MKEYNKFLCYTPESKSVEFSGKHSFTLHPSLDPYGRNHRQRNTYTCFAWAGGTFFQLCCYVSFWFWQEIGFGFTYLRTLLNNFFGTNIFLIVVEVLRYLLNPNFLFQHRNRYSEGMVTDRKLHVDTLIFIPT